MKTKLKDFIKKWNVGYEDIEQKIEFSNEMEAELNELINAAIEERVPSVSWNDAKERYMKFHNMDKFTENMAIDVDCI